MKKFLAIMMALSMMLCAFAVAETVSPVASTVASPVASPVADMVGDPADLPAIAAVLNGGSEVYVPSDKTNKTLQDALNHEFTEGAGYDSFAVLDVDGDGKLDVVLNVTVNGEVLGYLVLTSADEVICAYGFYYRAMIGLRKMAPSPSAAARRNPAWRPSTRTRTAMRSTMSWRKASWMKTKTSSIS
ncbi:MAG: FG-GAP repeat domain-containing protein [Christensenellales bacterium]